MAFITNKEAAARLGISKQRVWQLIQSGKLPAQKVGRDWIIDEKDLDLPQVRDRKPGRPRLGSLSQVPKQIFP